MSDHDTRPGPFARLGPNASYFFIATIVAGVAVLWFLHQTRLIPNYTLIFTAVLTLGGIFWSGTPTVLLLLLATLLFSAPGHFLGVLGGAYPPLSSVELLLAASFITYSALHARFTQVRDDESADAKRTRTVGSGDTTNGPPSLSPAQLTGNIGETLVYVVAALVVTTVARWLLPFFFIGRTWSDYYRLNPGVLGLLVAIVLLGLLSTLVPAIVRAIGRWGMNKEEATMTLNETVYGHLRPEFSQMARRLDRADQKK